MHHATSRHRARGLIVVAAVLAALAMGVQTAGTHPFVQEAAVDRGPGNSSFVEHTSVTAGSWDFQVLSVTGKPAWGLVQIVQGDPWRTVAMVDFRRPQTGDTLSIHLPAGTYSVRVWAWGGPPGSAVTISTMHPGI